MYQDVNFCIPTEIDAMASISVGIDAIEGAYKYRKD